MAYKKETALIYCENQFGLVDGKTATALVRHSELYTVVGVIDSSLAGRDAGEELSGEKSGIPIFKNLQEALSELPETPDCYIYGKAPLDTYISTEERLLVLEAMENGMNVINGLHQFFSDDREFAHTAAINNIKIKDIRKPPQLKDLHVFSGKISKINVPVIAILGTDCACGKRTTAVELNEALNNLGINSIFVATGQSGLMQGAMHGVSIDALTSQFVIGEIENSIVQAFEFERPDIILVEGQSAVGHPAFMSSIGILKGTMPDGVILQHPPARKRRCDFPDLQMPTVESEIDLIEAISKSKVLAITLSHEGLRNGEMPGIIANYEERFKLPTTDVLSYGCQKIVQTLIAHFPVLNTTIIQKGLETDPVMQKGGRNSPEINNETVYA